LSALTEEIILPQVKSFCQTGGLAITALAFSVLITTVCARDNKRNIGLSVLHDRSAMAGLIAADRSRRWLVQGAMLAAYLRLRAFYFYDNFQTLKFELCVS
jgi:hypothetical protein